MHFQCPLCRGIVAVDNTDVGTEVECGHCSQVVVVPVTRTSPGAVIADFLIINEIGKGGMGTVYLSHQISLDRSAALKILAENYANNSEFVAGFIKEARAAAKLNHPNIVQAYAVGEDEGIFYFAMEHISGETMKQVLKHDGIIAVDKALVIIQEIAEALSYAWNEQRLIHRDIKPDNIMLTSGGRAKLADLGLARVAGEDLTSEDIIGTPQYISPEHLQGAPMDVRSDIYSLGATFYHFITGRFPFEGVSATEISKKHLEEPLIPPAALNPGIPESVSRIVVKMMAKNPIMRYQTTESLIDDLRQARHELSQRSVVPLVAPSGGHSKKIKFSTAGVNSQTSSVKTATVQEQEKGDDRIARMRENNRRKARKRNITLSILGVVVLLLVGGGIFAGIKTGIFNKKSSDASSVGTLDGNSIIGTAKKLIALYNDENSDVSEFHAKAEEYYSTNRDKLASSENDPTLGKLNIAYLDADEILSNKGRDKAFAFLKSELDKRQIEYDKEQKRLKQEEEVIRARAEAEALAASRAEERKRLFEIKLTNMQKAAETEKARTAAILLASHDDERILKQFETFSNYLIKCADDESAEIQDISTANRPWLDDLKNTFESVQLIRETLYNGGDILKDKQIEHANEIYSIKNIANGKIDAVLLGTNRSASFQVSSLPVRQRLALLNAAAGLCNKPDYVYFYRFLDGEYPFVMTRMVKDDDEKSELLSYIVCSYLDSQIDATASKKAEIKEKFGKLKEYRERFSE